MDSENPKVNYRKSSLGRKSSTKSFIRIRSHPSVFSKLQGSESVVYNPKTPFDWFYKIIILGDERVGKTNLLLRLAN